MKTIKFRAWEYKRDWKKGEGYINDPHYQMVSQPYLYGDESSHEYDMVDLNKAFSQGGDASEGEKQHPTIFMQFTGLLDKNGIEIWEGDIVRAFDKIYEVMWGENIHLGYWMIQISSGFRESISLRKDNDEIEVIGNIYENK